MFTGLIQEIGKIEKIEILPNKEGIKFILSCDSLYPFLSLGCSISINGACQSVEKLESSHLFHIFSIPETIKATNFSFYRVKDLVNLELPLQFSSRLGGHLVQGHVDETISILEITKNKTSWNLILENKNFNLTVHKGSICLNGISLTLQEVKKEFIRVEIIPETIKNTNVIHWQAGQHINVEYDYLAKIVQHLLTHQQGIKNQQGIYDHTK